MGIWLDMIVSRTHNIIHTNIHHKYVQCPHSRNDHEYTCTHNIRTLMLYPTFPQTASQISIFLLNCPHGARNTAKKATWITWLQSHMPFSFQATTSHSTCDVHNQRQRYYNRNYSKSLDRIVVGRFYDSRRGDNFISWDTSKIG